MGNFLFLKNAQQCAYVREQMTVYTKKPCTFRLSYRILCKLRYLNVTHKNIR